MATARQCSRFRPRIEQKIRDREEASENNAETGLPKGHDPAREINNPNATFKHATGNPYLRPHQMADRIVRCLPITDRHTKERAAPQNHDEGDAKGKIDKTKSEQDVLGQDNGQSSEEKQDCSIDREE